MGDTMPPHADLLSPLRRHLCSRDNALRVAKRMTEDGLNATVSKAEEPLQPWRVVEADPEPVAGALAPRSPRSLE